MLYFEGASLTASIFGSIGLHDCCTQTGDRSHLATDGEIFGLGEWTLSDLAGHVWALFVAPTCFGNGVLAEATGLIAIDSREARVELTGIGWFLGTYLLATQSGGDVVWSSGRVNGNLLGGFVPPEKPYTMQVAGSVELDFMEDSDSVCLERDGGILKRFPWDWEGWPHHLLGGLRLLIEDEVGPVG